jgi:hypothetical protein
MSSSNRSPGEGVSPAGSASRPAVSGASSTSSSTHQQHIPKQSSGLRHFEMPPATPPEHGQARGIASEDEAFDSDRSSTHKEELGDSAHEQSRLLGEGSSQDVVDEHGHQVPRPRYSTGYGSFADFIYTGKINSRLGQRRSRPNTQDGQQDEHDPSPTMLNRSDTYAASLAGDSMIDGLMGRSKQRGIKHWFSSNPAIKQERSVYVVSSWLVQLEYTLDLHEGLRCTIYRCGQADSIR